MALYGIDLHSDSFTVATVAGLDRSQRREVFSVPLSGERFVRFKARLRKEDVILIEATTQSFWFYDQVAERVRDCYVFNPHVLDHKRNKTDKIDANMLLDRITYNELMIDDPAKLPYVHIPDPQVRELRGMLSTYMLLRKMVTQSINRIHSIYKQQGIRLERSHLTFKANREQLLVQAELPAMWMVQICTLVNCLETLQAGKKQVKDLICFYGYQLFSRQIRLLMSIKGVSMLIATALMADIVTVERFPSAKKFCSYLRTAPTVQASNDTVHLGRTNKQARSLTCTMMTQAIGHFTSCRHFSDFKDRLSTGKRPGTVRIAIIRKTLTCAYHMLKRNQLFRWVETESYQRKIVELDRLVSRFEKKAIQNEGDFRKVS